MEDKLELVPKLVKESVSLSLTQNIRNSITDAFLHGIVNQLGTKISYSVNSDPFQLFYEENVLEYVFGKMIKRVYPSAVMVGYRTTDVPTWALKARNRRKAKIYKILGSGYLLLCPFDKSCILYITIEDKANDEGDLTKRKYTVLFIGRRRMQVIKKLNRIIDNLMKESCNKIHGHDLTVYLGHDRMSWSVPAKSFDDVFLNKEIKEDLMNSLQMFQNNDTRKLYEDLNEPYHMNILLYGNPGTGKNSIAYAICEYLHADSIINLSNARIYKDSSTLYGYISTGDIIIIDEIDTIVSKRENFKTDDQRDRFKNLLFFLDNVTNGTIVICCTNYIERLDPALIRSGRFNKKYEISDWDYETLQEALKAYNVTEEQLQEKISTISFSENSKFNPAQMMDAIKQIRMEKLNINDEEFHTSSDIIIEEE